MLEYVFDADTERRRLGHPPRVTFLGRRPSDPEHQISHTVELPRQHAHTCTTATFQLQVGTCYPHSHLVPYPCPYPHPIRVPIVPSLSPFLFLSHPHPVSVSTPTPILRPSSPLLALPLQDSIRDKLRPITVTLAYGIQGAGTPRHSRSATLPPLPPVLSPQQPSSHRTEVRGRLWGQL